MPPATSRSRRSRTACGGVALVLALAAGAATGCATLQQLANLAEVDFHLDRVSGVRLAGVRLDGVRDWSALSALDALRIADAYRRGSLPLSLTLHVTAENPAVNEVAARLSDLDWRLLVRGRETIRGGLGRRDVSLPPGRPVDLPLQAELDLLRFFQDDARALAEIAFDALGSRDGRPRGLELRARPTITTALGPITYPGEIAIRTR